MRSSRLLAAERAGLLFSEKCGETQLVRPPSYLRETKYYQRAVARCCFDGVLNQRSQAPDPFDLCNVAPGVYLAGVIVARMHTNEIFIENGRFHGEKIAEAIASR